MRPDFFRKRAEDRRQQIGADGDHDKNDQNFHVGLLSAELSNGKLGIC